MDDKNVFVADFAVYVKVLARYHLSDFHEESSQQMLISPEDCEEPHLKRRQYGDPKMTFSILFSKELFRNYELIIRKNYLIIRNYELLHCISYSRIINSFLRIIYSFLRIINSLVSSFICLQYTVLKHR